MDIRHFKKVELEPKFKNTKVGSCSAMTLSRTIDDTHAVVARPKWSEEEEPEQSGHHC